MHQAKPMNLPPVHEDFFFLGLLLVCPDYCRPGTSNKSCSFCSCFVLTQTSLFSNLVFVILATVTISCYSGTWKWMGYSILGSKWSPPLQAPLSPLKLMHWKLNKWPSVRILSEFNKGGHNVVVDRCMSKSHHHTNVNVFLVCACAIGIFNKITLFMASKGTLAMFYRLCCIYSTHVFWFRRAGTELAMESEYLAAGSRLLSAAMIPNPKLSIRYTAVSQEQEQLFNLDRGSAAKWLSHNRSWAQGMWGSLHTHTNQSSLSIIKKKLFW